MTVCLDRLHLHVEQCYLAGIHEGRRIALENRAQSAEQPVEQPETPAPAPEAVSGDFPTSVACRSTPSRRCLSAVIGADCASVCRFVGAQQ